jgi:peptide/nickel transport system substrate-binding protein
MADFTPSPSIDPDRSIGAGGDGKLPAVFDPLIRYVAGTGPGTGLVPALATAWRWINPTLLDLTLRKNVTFHDGTPFDASAVKANFDRTMSDPKAGANDITAVANIKSVTVLSDYDVQFQLKNQQPSWITNLTWGPGYMESPKAFAGNTDVNAIGTGPFKLTRYQTLVGADYVRNDSYWDANFVKCAPREFHLLNIVDAQAQLNGLSSGQLAVGYVAPASAPQAKSTGLNVKTTPGPAASSLFFNRGRPPFNNEKVRQALMYAIDRDAIAKGIYKGLAEPDVQLFPTLAESYNQGANYQPKAYAYNPTRAKQLLTDAGFPNGITITLDVDQSRTVDLDLAQALQSQMAAAGITVKIAQTPSVNVFYSGTNDMKYAAQSGKLDETDLVEGAVGSTLLNPGKVPVPSDIAPVWQDTRTLDFGSAKRKTQEQDISAYITDHALIVPIVTVDKVYAISPCALNFKPTLQGAYTPVAIQWKKGCKFP